VRTQNDVCVGRSPWTARDPLIPLKAGQGAGRGRGRPPHWVSVFAPALVFPALLLATLARAEENPPVNDLFAEIASDLSQSDASAFMSHFDPKMSGYDRLYEFVRALSGQDAVSSGIDILKDTGDDRERAVELDWTLEISVGKEMDSAVERRQEKVHCKLERRKKRWVVTALEPITFFAPPR